MGVKHSRPRSVSLANRTLTRLAIPDVGQHLLRPAAPPGGPGADAAPPAVRLVVLSDSHGFHRDVELPPEGDILVHCGDFTKWKRSRADLDAFDTWLGELRDRFRYRVVVGGNHDLALQKAKKGGPALKNATHVLCDSGCVIEGLRFWGSPWTPYRNMWYRANAFTKGPDAMKKAFAAIPEGLDVLVTHSPPFSVLDEGGGGSIQLAEEVARAQPRLHCFGHRHNDRGACARFEGEGEERKEDQKLSETEVKVVVADDDIEAAKQHESKEAQGDGESKEDGERTVSDALGVKGRAVTIFLNAASPDGKAAAGNMRPAIEVPVAPVAARL